MQLKNHDAFLALKPGPNINITKLTKRITVCCKCNVRNPITHLIDKKTLPLFSTPTQLASSPFSFDGFF